MTARIAVQAGSIVLAVLAGWVVPALGMRMLMPSLEATAPRVTNYRGVPVPLGLGAVWLMWAVGFVAAGVVLQLKTAFLQPFLPPGTISLLASSGVTPWGGFYVPVALVLGAAGFGLLDDVFGRGDARGFRGHMRSLRRGRLTTGALKMIGIGVLSVGAAVTATQRTAITRGALSSGGAWGWFNAQWLLAVVFGSLVIALTANLVNLTDLRPGRALKTYAIIAVPSVIGLGWLEWSIARRVAVVTNLVKPGGLEAGGLLVALLILVIGPVLAVWRYDLGEKAMLGDAGANAAGAFAGFLLASALPLWGLVIAAAILLALNLASERISFSDVIEANSFLRWLDGLGRVHAQVGVTTSAEGAPTDDDRDGSATDGGKDG